MRGIVRRIVGLALASTAPATQHRRSDRGAEGVDLVVVVMRFNGQAPGRRCV